jgi:FADH2-dependent halogenase
MRITIHKRTRIIFANAGLSNSSRVAPASGVPSSHAALAPNATVRKNPAVISDTYDALIIGGGPGGCSVATYLARAGKHVLVLEKEIFPRFHIGESLLPYNAAIFRELGVWDTLAAAGFPKKVGAQFHLSNGTLSTRFIFREGRFTREPEVFQVERAKFDHILLKHARASSADVREGWTVQKTSSEPDRVTLDATDAHGVKHQFIGKFLVDASGRANLTGNQEGLRVIHPRLKKLAVFGHFTGVQHDPGDSGGDTVIFRLENKWFWLIPISAEKTSVGLVLDKDEFAQSGGKPTEIFQRWLDATAPLKDRMTNARLVGEMQTTTDFSYYNRRLVGQRLLRVGDAAGFMDPIFSAGVFLAMWSGKLAAEVIQQSLIRNDDGARRAVRYEKRVTHGMNFYWRMVENYYTKPFMELFLQPRNHVDLPAAVNAVLAGELEGGWKLHWRLQYFYWLVKLQARRAIVPRLTFRPIRIVTKNPASCTTQG